MTRRPVLIADLFCGAGGSSTGAVRALRRMGVDVTLACVNHWPVAIETHQRNHPEARHYCVDLESARPEDIVPEGRLDLLMASPTCTYHSRARGGRPTSDQQRMDPWHIVRWCTTLRVQRLMIENVPEFVDWGPVDVRTGRPVKSRKGEYFRAWVVALQAIGFKMEWRVLNAADYGDATTRRRFFLLGRTDARPIRWPQPTHASAEKARLLGLAPWRSAREIIDWDIPGQSIFVRRRPLAANTLKRIAAGLARFGGDYAAPFLVVLRNNCAARGIDLPLPTLTAGGGHLGLVQPSLMPFVLGQQSGAVARDVARPLPTVATGGAISLIEPIVVQTDQDQPIPSMVTKRNLALAEAFIAPYYGSGSGETGKSVAEPLDTVTTKARFGLVEPFIVPHFGERDRQVARTHDLGAPLPTVTSRGAGSLVVGALQPTAMSAAADRIVMLGGKPYLLDILFRMVKNHELARAMSFSDAETEYEFVGNQTQVTKQIGNAVPIGTSTALVAALFSDIAQVQAVPAEAAE